MKKKVFCFVIISCFFIVQNIIAGGGNVSGFSSSQNSLSEFKRRLLEIMNDNEVNNIIADSIIFLNESGSSFNYGAWTPAAYGFYANSQNSLQDFIRRYNEIINDVEFSNFPNIYNIPYFFINNYYGSYAGSQNSLQSFKERFNEIINNIEFNDNYSSLPWSSYYYGYYAASQYSLQEYRRRLNEIINDNEFNNIQNVHYTLYYGQYAASQYTLQEYKRRFNEVMNDIEIINIQIEPGYRYFHYGYDYY